MKNATDNLNFTKVMALFDFLSRKTQIDIIMIKFGFHNYATFRKKFYKEKRHYSCSDAIEHILNQTYSRRITSNIIEHFIKTNLDYFVNDFFKDDLSDEYWFELNDRLYHISRIDELFKQLLGYIGYSMHNKDESFNDKPFNEYTDTEKLQYLQKEKDYV